MNFKLLLLLNLLIILSIIYLFFISIFKKYYFNQNEILRFEKQILSKLNDNFKVSDKIMYLKLLTNNNKFRY